MKVEQGYFRDAESPDSCEEFAGLEGSEAI